MNNTSHILHFSIGPVQGFVAQARRTRDLWAGSFLLSWLAGQAMAAVLENDGSIKFPSVGSRDEPTDELLKAILEKGHDNPPIGSLPNRFKATIPDSFDPNIIQNQIMKKWLGLCEAVWQQFIEPIEAYENETKRIWDRQVKNFWEIQWVLGQSDDLNEDGRWLDIRKNWRNHLPTEEGGDHCVLMNDYQELSGFIRAQEKDKQNQFWEQLRDKLGLLDLGDDERLCSIALVKRLFPKLKEPRLKQTIGWVPGGKREYTGNWPSTVYMAAVPWLEKIIANGKIDNLRDYVNLVEDKVEDKNSIKSERATVIASLKPLGDLASQDGNFFLETALTNHRARPLSKTKSDSGKDPDQEAREELIIHLKKLNEKVGEPASPYYALLLMDGDHLGKLLQMNEAYAISESLSKFTGNVSEIVKNKNGFTIYAGGDDVLAILPINTAIQCAIELKTAYTESFIDIKNKDKDKFSASSAIIFTHFHNALREVLREAHHQLDDIAKERNGRDSLALALLKPSGKAAEWCATWNSHVEINPPNKLLEFKNEIEKKHFSTGYFYHLRQRYPMLIDDKTNKIADMDIKPILVAEYMKSRELEIGKSLSQEEKQKEVEKRIQILLDACYGYKRENEKNNRNENQVQIEGIRLAHFLAKGGIRE